MQQDCASMKSRKTYVQILVSKNFKAVPPSRRLLYQQYFKPVRCDAIKCKSGSSKVQTDPIRSSLVKATIPGLSPEPRKSQFSSKDCASCDNQARIRGSIKSTTLSRPSPAQLPHTRSEPDVDHTKQTCNHEQLISAEQAQFVECGEQKEASCENKDLLLELFGEPSPVHTLLPARFSEHENSPRLMKNNAFPADCRIGLKNCEKACFCTSFETKLISKERLHENSNEPAEVMPRFSSQNNVHQKIVKGRYIKTMTNSTSLVLTEAEKLQKEQNEKLFTASNNLLSAETQSTSASQETADSNSTIFIKSPAKKHSVESSNKHNNKVSQNFCINKTKKRLVKQNCAESFTGRDKLKGNHEMSPAAQLRYVRQNRLSSKERRSHAKAEFFVRKLEEEADDLRKSLRRLVRRQKRTWKQYRNSQNRLKTMRRKDLEINLKYSLIENKEHCLLFPL